VLQCPGQQAFAELGHLQTIAQDNGIAADQIDAADVGVEVDPHAGPVEPRGNLFDVRALARAVIALHHHAAVEGKAGQDCQGGVRIEHIGIVRIRRALIGDAEGRNLHVDVDPEHLAHVDSDVGRGQDGLVGGVGAGGLVGHITGSPIRAGARLQ